VRPFVAAVAFCAAAASASQAFGQAPLSVPYLPQTEALCGGAATAMVMRFWGARDIYADAFAPLVDRSAGGIRTSALVRDVERRGWTAEAGAGDLVRLSAEVARGRPVIALIEDRPGRYHYVVVVAAPPAGPIVLHDPARAPDRAVDASSFDARWAKAERWMLVLSPGAIQTAVGSDRDVRAGADPPPNHTSRPDSAVTAGCQPHVADGIALAERGDKAGARRALETAAAACPQAGAPWREIAGLDAIEERWAAAATHAQRAVSLDPDDDHAWRVLATAEFVQHNDLAALAAWNRIGEPRADLVEIRGLKHTRYLVVADAIGIAPRELLTPPRLRLAQRRAQHVPALAAARVTYRPIADGRAVVDAAIVERARAPLGYAAWGGIALGAIANREAVASLANVSGGGDSVAVSWRWWEHRPKVAVSYAAPGPGGIWRVDASTETQTFAEAGGTIEETRTRGGIELTNWIDQRTRLGAGVAIERWTDRRRTVAWSGRAEIWPVLDRLVLEAGGTTWTGSGDPFGAADVVLRWRSKSIPTGTVWLANTGYRIATTAAPASIWPGADTGHAREVLLRAHPLLDDGIISDGVFGRRVAHGGAEVQHWLTPGSQRVVRVAPAAFLDIARATRGLAQSDRRVHYDAGAGLRVSVAGMGVLRIDVARGVRDGRMAVSVGWQR
jgi:hypothetical protein